MRTAGSGRVFGMVLLLAVLAGGCGPDRGDRPVNVFLITIDTLRADYLGAYAQPVTDADVADLPVEVIRQAYRAEVFETDRILGRLLDALEAAGLLEETLVVVTSDQGEYLGEHGLTNHHRLYEEVLHVPLIIHAPGMTKDIQDVMIPGRDELYDLAAYPAAQHDLASAKPSVAGRMRTLLSDHIRDDLPDGLAGTDDIQLDARTLEMLKSLGYVR